MPSPIWASCNPSLVSLALVSLCLSAQDRLGVCPSGWRGSGTSEKLWPPEKANQDELITHVNILLPLRHGEAHD